MIKVTEKRMLDLLEKVCSVPEVTPVGTLQMEVMKMVDTQKTNEWIQS